MLDHSATLSCTNYVIDSFLYCEIPCWSLDRMHQNFSSENMPIFKQHNQNSRLITNVTIMTSLNIEIYCFVRMTSETSPCKLIYKWEESSSATTTRDKERDIETQKVRELNQK